MADHDYRYDKFREICSQTTDSNVLEFRRNPYIRSMVDNVTPQFGIDYYYAILKSYVDVCKHVDWNAVERLMSIGNPIDKQNYMFCDNRYVFSPKALCYIKFTFDILAHVRDHTQLKEMNVVEIGGGYGCQAVLMYEMAKHFGITIKSYTIVDLPEVNILQRAFVKACASASGPNELAVRCVSPEEYVVQSNTLAENPDLVISNYALGEFNRYWQNYYVEHIVSKVNHGYFCWNFSPTNPTIHPYFESVDGLVKEEENPQTNTPPIKSFVLRY